MSFDKLKKSSYSAKSQEVVIESGGDKITFHAKELSYLQRLDLSTIKESGGDFYSHLVVMSIVDQDGKHMTLDQCSSLDPEIQEKFFLAAAKVNAQEQEPAKKKSVRKPKTKARTKR